MVLAEPSSFLALINQAGVDTSDFMGVWWDAFDRLALSSMRKRVALASAALCSTGNPAVLSRFGELLNVFLDVLGELKGQSPPSLLVRIFSCGGADDVSWRFSRRQKRNRTRVETRRARARSTCTGNEAVTPQSQATQRVRPKENA